jgi:hypothetical protein
MPKQPAKSVEKPAEAKPTKTEDKAERFSKAASIRVTRAVRSIRRIGALSGSRYEKSQSQLAKIESVLTAEVRIALEKLRGPAPISDDEIAI